MDIFSRLDDEEQRKRLKYGVITAGVATKVYIPTNC